MNYEQTIQYLYNLLPVYHRIGAKAFKPGLDNMYKILEHLGNPHQNLKFIHVGGTNGKGSSSHLIASILQESGYKVGLYTSPHLKRFTERIRINGKEIDKQRVVSFVENNKSLIEDLKPSFFELTVGMAFEEFEFQQVDYAVIEVGLGGRLDSTNIINPLLSLITNISYDHTDLLGDTLVKIASEKAGIIKKNKPVVISERNLETDFVFESKAESLFSELNFAEDHFTLKNFNVLNGYSVVEFLDNSLGGITTYKLPLLGEHQIKNLFVLSFELSI